MLEIAQCRALLLDLDGVLYRGTETLPGAREVPATLERLGMQYLCLTNNSMRTPAVVAADLQQRGINISPEHILTSGTAAALVLRERYPAGTSVYVIGMHGLHTAIFGDGYFVPGERDATVVVVGSNFDLHYTNLKIATLALRAGATFIATNPDTTFPSHEGLIPGAGATIAALVAASGRTPEIIGKPQPALFQAALERLKLPASAVLMVGDRLDTDIAGAQHLGIGTVFVESGVDTAAAAAAWVPAPNLRLAHVAALLEVLEQQRVVGP